MPNKNSQLRFDQGLLDHVNHAGTPKKLIHIKLILPSSFTQDNITKQASTMGLS